MKKPTIEDVLEMIDYLKGLAENDLVRMTATEVVARNDEAYKQDEGYKVVTWEEIEYGERFEFVSDLWSSLTEDAWTKVRVVDNTTPYQMSHDRLWKGHHKQGFLVKCK